MADFSIQTNIQILPLEEISFTDTTQKAKGIHSTIDRTFSGSFSKACGTVGAKIQNGSVSVEKETSVFVSEFVTGGTSLYYLYLKNTGTVTTTLKYTEGEVDHPICTIHAGQFCVISPEAGFAGFYLENLSSTIDVTVEYLAYSYTV
jgi:hypothetical protein